jgi:hypothetical protein
MKEMNLENMQRVPMPADNHCGYHALVFNLKRVGHPRFNSECSIKEQILFLKDILIRTYEELRLPRAKRLRMHPNEWLDDKDMEILSKYFNICIHVKDERIEQGKLSQNMVQDAPVLSFIGDEKSCENNFYMVQTTGHFDVLLPNNVSVDDVPLSDVTITKKDILNFMSENPIEQQELSPEIVNVPKNSPSSPRFLGKKKYVDIPHRDTVLSNKEIEKLIEQKLHERIFPTWLR